jgi:leader peptidase (prepilin peptidase)/N-methyltransferase
VLIYLFLCGGNGIDGLNLKLVGYMVVASCLVVTAWIDFKHQIIPDSMWISIFVGGIFIVIDAVINGEFSKEYIISKLIGLFTISGLFLIVGLLSGGRAMGGGDVKLMAATGFVLGWKAVIVSLFFAAIAGVVFSFFRKIFTKQEMRGVIPFGPFLAIGVMASAFCGEWIFNKYLSLFI